MHLLWVLLFITTVVIGLSEEIPKRMVVSVKLTSPAKVIVSYEMVRNGEAYRETRTEKAYAGVQFAPNFPIINYSEKPVQIHVTILADATAQDPAPKPITFDYAVPYREGIMTLSPNPAGGNATVVSEGFFDLDPTLAGKSVNLSTLDFLKTKEAPLGLDSRVSGIITTQCQACHQGTDQDRIDLGQFTENLGFPWKKMGEGGGAYYSRRESLTEILSRVETRVMPPGDGPSLNDSDFNYLVTWIKSQLREPSTNGTLPAKKKSQKTRVHSG